MQVNANVNAANFLMMGNQAPEKDAAKNGGGLDFASFLSKPAQDKESVVSPSAGRMDKKPTEGKQSEVSASKPDQKIRSSAKTSDTDGTTVQKKADPGNGQGKEAVSQAGGQDISEEDAAKLQELAGNLFQLLLEPLKLSPEELLESLSDMGMELADLLSSDGLKELFLNVKMADPMELVVNEDLNGELQGLLGAWEDLLEDAGISMEDVTGQVSERDLTDALFMHQSDDAVSEKDGKRFMKHQEQFDQVEDSNLNQTGKPDAQVQVVKESGSFQNTQDTESGEAEYAKGRETRPGQNPVSDPIMNAVKDAVDQIEIPELNGQQTVSGSEVVDQIVTQIKVNMNRATTSMELQLYPEHLGKIQIHVVSKDGVMTARIVAESEAARQAIEGGLTSLKEAMEGQDLKVEAIEVMVSTAGFERGNEEQKSFEQNSSSRGGRRGQFPETSEETAEEETDLLMEHTGSSVSYTA